MTRTFTNESLFDIVQYLQEALPSHRESSKTLSFKVVDPDLSHELFPGEHIQVDGQTYTYRSYQQWMELAEQLDCRFLTPRLEAPHFVQIRFRPLQIQDSWHKTALPSGHHEKYGVDSDFFRIHKLEEPSFLIEYLESLKMVALPPGARILNIGVNKGDEFELFRKWLPSETLESMHFVGIDHSATAMKYARTQFPEPTFSFITADLNEFEQLQLGQFDLIISIGTLHSPKLKGHDLFRILVKQHLTETGCVILGFPNCRYLDYSLRFGAKVKNYRRPELSLLFKEITYFKRYLQQQRFRVTLAGKHTLFLTANRLPKK